jgi:hypothetical protein
LRQTEVESEALHLRSSAANEKSIEGFEALCLQFSGSIEIASYAVPALHPRDIGSNKFTFAYKVKGAWPIQ